MLRLKGKKLNIVVRKEKKKKDKAKIRSKLLKMAMTDMLSTTLSLILPFVKSDITFRSQIRIFKRMMRAISLLPHPSKERNSTKKTKVK